MNTFSIMLFILGFLTHSIESTRDYLVGIRNSETGQNYCSGALVSNRYVITSNRCSMATRALEGWTETSQFVVIGSAHVSGAGGETIRVTGSFSHPDFNAASGANDYLLALAWPTTRTPAGLLPDNFAHVNPFLTGAYLEVTGWGLFTGAAAEAVTLPMEVIDNAVAQRLIAVHDNELALLNINTNITQCRTEYGSPVTATVGTTTYIDGVVTEIDG